jgi:hypothetical protein
VKLGSSNFREWREELNIAALQFGNAGKALRSGIKPVYIEPGREDRKRIKPPHDIVTDAEFVNMLAPQLVLAKDPADEIAMEIAMEQLSFVI